MIFQSISYTLFQALWEREPDLGNKIHELDSIVNKLLRRIGFLVMSLVLLELSSQVTQKARATGLTIHRAKRVKYLSLFGAIDIPSPYLWNKSTGREARSVKEQLGIEPGQSSVAVQRGLSDFGTEESFGCLPKRFKEHYDGWAIERATVRREVEKTAQKAQQYVETRLFAASGDYLQPLNIRPGVEQLLVELDGCHIRTGQKVAPPTVELTPKRRKPKYQRQINWREVSIKCQVFCVS